MVLTLYCRTQVTFDAIYFFTCMRLRLLYLSIYQPNQIETRVALQDRNTLQQPDAFLHEPSV